MTASEQRDEKPRTEREPKNTLIISNITGALYLTTRQCLLSSKKKAGVFLVEFEYGGRKERTLWSASTAKPIWSNDLIFPCLNAPSGEILTIRVFYEKKGKEKLRCEAEDVVANLDVSKPLDKVIRVSKWVNGTVPDLHLDFRLTISSLGFNASKPAASDHVALPTVLETSPATDHAFDEIHRLGDGVDAMQPIGESLATVIDNVDPVFKIIEDISEIHPYAKLAFSIVTAAYTVLKAQRDRDDKVNDLITTMRETYEAIWAAKEKWENADSLNAVWDKVSDVTMDCCNFISKYRETKAFSEFAPN
ncbi:hypothetical protein SISNIDRAFT_484539 [Sistotremastrum niveocremeum HHB9708]|uniref:C2 domain-containing protein n=1 Tax=Sistotremastrum niveocremeum HHB9708 TaxID=1314777 RepID=A0A164VN04_9AGAM|nr:hypothetical protein SISNIDRAFT_484539 [Sistotremastrum niveocremeum HHB9708]